MYYVISKYYDNGRTEAYITEKEQKIGFEYHVTEHYDMYIDACETLEDAKKLVEEVKKA